MLSCRTILGFLLFSLQILLPPSNAHALIITADTVWQNEVLLTEDVLVPTGRTLTVRAGTRVIVSPAESTKTDPEFISPQAEITVRGSIRIEGDASAPVSFRPAATGKNENWAGIILDGGIADIQDCTITGADAAIYLLDASLTAKRLTLSGNRHGITVVGDRSKVRISGSRISDNDYGLTVISRTPPLLTETTVGGNRKKDRWDETIPASPSYPPTEEAPPTLPVSRTYTNEALVGDIVWQGRIRVEGNLRIAEGSRLLIAPGTVIEFTKRDTNGDGIGENGILIQGTIVAKGTKQAPIRFRSAEAQRQMGDWDSVNLMNSDKAENLFENCIFEDAYRGLHFHYSTVKVSGARFRNNFRGVQFQESAVEIVASEFLDNHSGVQGRDSRVRFNGNHLFDNHQGVNFFRTSLTFSANSICGSLKEAVRIREGNASVSRNVISGNRQGLLLADIYYGSVNGNLLAGNSENGLSMRTVDNIEVSGNYIGRNGANGLNLQDARADIRENLIAFNGERGIGIVSFAGRIAANDIAGNGLFAIDLEASDDVDANGNWWGGDEPAAVVFDQRRDRSRGRVISDTVAPRPFPFSWPLDEFPGEITLAGDIVIAGKPTVPPGAFLTISPGTTVRFAAGAGLTVNGRLLSVGLPSNPVRFTAREGTQPGSWDEITIERAIDSRIAYTLIEYATWGIHSHFTNLLVDHLLARNNSGGLRFRSGPVTIRQSVFRENGIGIRAYLGTALIEENLFTANEVGLFVREQGSGLTVRRNNFVNNSDYNIRSGDFNSENIAAPDNWWGVQDPGTTIYDGRQEEGVGKVLFEPFRTSPVPLESAGIP